MRWTSRTDWINDMASAALENGHVDEGALISSFSLRMWLALILEARSGKPRSARPAAWRQRTMFVYPGIRIVIFTVRIFVVRGVPGSMARGSTACSGSGAVISLDGVGVHTRAIVVRVDPEHGPPDEGEVLRG